MNSKSFIHQAGFTLLELMIVVAIVGILAAIAYPSYVEQVTKSRRADGKSLLMGVVSRQEQYFLDNKIYANNMTKLGYASNPQPSDRGYYQVDVSASTATTYTLRAVPLGQQSTADTLCVNFTINEVGTKGVSTGTDPNLCW